MSKRAFDLKNSFFFLLGFLAFGFASVHAQEVRPTQAPSEVPRGVAGGRPTPAMARLIHLLQLKNCYRALVSLNFTDDRLNDQMTVPQVRALVLTEFNEAIRSAGAQTLMMENGGDGEERAHFQRAVQACGRVTGDRGIAARLRALSHAAQAAQTAL